MKTIKVIGVGGGGCNAVSYMKASQVEGMEFIGANTDSEALKLTKAHVHLQLGKRLTKGTGSSADIETGRQAAMEARERISEVLAGADMVFILAGMGGGTGTGGAPVVAEIVQELGILTIGVVTLPFGFEGDHRIKQAQNGRFHLSRHVNLLITIPNSHLPQKDISILQFFHEINELQKKAIQNIADLIREPGIINIGITERHPLVSNENPIFCSFCGKTRSGRRSVVNPSGHVCEECICLFQKPLENEAMDEDGTPIPAFLRRSRD